MLVYFGGLAVILIAAYFTSRTRAMALTSQTAQVHSLPSYHGYWTVLAGFVPAILIYAAGTVIGLPSDRTRTAGRRSTPMIRAASAAGAETSMDG